MTLEPGKSLQTDASATERADKTAREPVDKPDEREPGDRKPGDGPMANKSASLIDSLGANSGANSEASPATSSIDSALNRLNNAEKLAQAKDALAKGQAVFERGRYKRAIALFQTALSFANPIGALGGEIQMWLVNAYVAAGDDEAGLALCRKLIRHPDLDTKQQSKRLLYILEAPELEMNPDWVTKIPDLNNLDDDSRKPYRQKARKPRRKKKPEPEPLDLSEVNTDDNQFIWIALIGIMLTLGGLFWFR